MVLTDWVILFSRNLFYKLYTHKRIQYKEGIHHEDCINIAKLCNQAVDFGKNGNSVDINKAPRLPTTKKPDWMKGEYYDAEVSLDQFYESGRAIGMIYRFIDSLRPSSNEGEGHRITYSSICSTLGPIVREKIGQGIQSSSQERILSMFEMFKSECHGYLVIWTVWDCSIVFLLRCSTGGSSGCSYIPGVDCCPFYAFYYSFCTIFICPCAGGFSPCISWKGVLSPHYLLYYFYISTFM